MTLAAFIELIAKIKQKNNGTFKLVDAQDVECEDGKGLDEVLNEKLDENQGIENVGKTMVVGADGNLVVGDSPPKNVYTKEEVDYMLADKMDKPYVPIEITDNATITDALEGNFKIDKIKGNTYQNVETDIVPTPQRPVPINSRKTTITKINPNIFDFEKENDTSKIPDSGTYRSIGQYQLKANTKYIFEWTEATVPAKATLSFQIQDDKGTVLVSPFTYFNIQADEKKEAGKEVEFTTNESGIIKFAYNCIVGTSNTIETYQQYWYTKILKDITLKENATFEPEYVELRSLKETGNLFDLKYGQLLFGEKVGSTTNNGSGVIIENYYAITTNLAVVYLKANTNYCFKSNRAKEPIEGMEESGNDLNMLNVLKGNTPIIQVISGSTFTVNDSGYYYLRLYGTVGCKVSYTSIMLVEGKSAPSSYIPPTVRDYKIVDHTTKTSKIVRNIGVVNLTNLTWTYGDRDLNHIRCYAVPSTPLKYVEQHSYCNVFESNYLKYDYSKEAIYLGNNIGGKTISIMANQDIFTGHNADQFDRLLKEYINNPNAIAYYALETPTEEPITYVETDVNEVGYSWQDTTSPSPTIKSEVKGVEKIDILKTGKNLFDVDKVIDGERLKNNGDGSLTVITTADDSSASNNIQKLSDIANLTVGETYTLSAKTTGTQKQIWLKKSRSIWFFGKSKTITQDDLDSIVYFHASGINTQAIVSDIQLEMGDTQTPYEPYRGQKISITPPQPMYSTLDGNIADEVDVEKGVYRYWLLKDKIENLATAVNIAQKHGNFQSYSITKVKDNSLKPITLLGNEDTRNLICNKCNVNLLDYNNEKETFSLYVDKSAVFVGNINIERLNENTTLNIYNFIKDFEIVYPLLTPIEIPIPQEDLKLLKSLKTEQGVTNIFVGGEVKPTIEARYPRDLALVQQQLEQKVLLMSETLTETKANLLLQGGQN